MGIGTGIFLLALGAVLTFAVDVSVSGISLSTIGVILMIAGAIGLAVALVVRNRRTEEHVVHERGHAA